MTPRRYCFTLNNYTPVELETILDLVWTETRNGTETLKSLDYRYMVVGIEVGAEGTPHLQGYISFGKQVRFNTLKRALPRAHIEPCKGSHWQNVDYCKKGGNFVERGNPGQRPGSRNDLDEIRDLARRDGMRSVVSTGNYQQIRVAEKFLSYSEPQRMLDEPPRVVWCYGPTGTGKTRWVVEQVADSEYYWKSDGSKWWPSYDGHPIVILDDFRASWCKLHQLLGLLDRYPYRVEYKGGYRQMLASTFYITAPMHPRDCYANINLHHSDAVDQLLRRITEVRHFDTPFGYEPLRTVPEVGGNTTPQPLVQVGDAELTQAYPPALVRSNAGYGGDPSGFPMDVE